MIGRRRRISEIRIMIRKFHIILAIIYGVLWMVSSIFILAHLKEFEPNRLAIYFWVSGIHTWPAYIIVWYILRRMKKDNAALASWYSVVMPTMYSVTVGAIVKAFLVKSHPSGSSSVYLLNSYWIVAVYYASLLPFMWHLSVVGKYRNIMKTSSPSISYFTKCGDK